MANVRVLAAAPVPKLNNIKTVNILSADTHPNQHKTHVQVNSSQHVPGVQPQFIAGPTGTVGIPTIVILGYTGPA